METCAPASAARSNADAVALRARLIEDALAAGLEHHRCGALSAAAEMYAGILELDPHHPQALHLCGVIAHQQGAHGLARELVQRALDVAPDHPQAHNTLGAVLQATGDIEGAQQCFETALALAPGYPDALQNYGLLHASRGDHARAADHYRRAISGGRRSADLLVLLGNSLEADDQHAQARTAFDEALALAPAHLHAMLGLAGALRSLGRYDEACAAFDQATTLDPGSVDAWTGLGTTLLDMLDTKRAIECFDRALVQHPDDGLVRWNRALACLVAGRLDEGWHDHAWRWQSTGFDSVERTYAAPRWDGSSALSGRTVLLWREQGIGDELVFASMLNDAAKAARHLIVECEPRLIHLLRRSFPGIDFVAAAFPPHPATASPAIDVHAPIGDLAPFLRPTLSSFPPTRSHLIADPARIEHWRQVLATLGPKPKIGISWRSANLRGVRALACSTLAQWEPILHAIDADWINLQYDRCDEELELARAAMGIAIHRMPGLDMHSDLDDTAALMSALDLVICAPTTVSILAAGAGVPTWQLASGADWQTLGENRVPWLPALRRFYRPWHVGWPTVLEQVAQALPDWLDARNAAGCRGLSALAGHDEVLP